MWNETDLEKFEGTLFKKIIQLIEFYLEQNLLIDGERLPSERELAKTLRVNRSTVVHALDILTERGVLIRHQGSGTFVNDQKWGVQTYPTINWRLPINFYQKPLSFYQQKIEQLQQQKGKFYDLANGDLPTILIPKLTLPDISSHQLVLHENNSDKLQLGLPLLKQQIAKYMQRLFAMSVDIDDILITSGTQQSLFLISQGLLKPGDAIGIESPSYFYSLPLFQAAGLRLYGIKMDHDGITLDSLSEVIEKHHIKWLFLNPVFQNPTGYIMSKTRQKNILSFCKENRIGIVEDDAYSGLSFSKQLDISPIKKLDDGNQVIYLGSLSKYVGRNIRVGWMIAPKEVIGKLAQIRQHIDSGLSVLPQLLAYDYLKNHYIKHQDSLKEYLKIHLEKLLQWLEYQFSDAITYHKPLGGFHLYANINNSATQNETAMLNQLLSKKVIVSQGNNFGDKSKFIRFSYGHFDNNLLK